MFLLEVCMYVPGKHTYLENYRYVCMHVWVRSGLAWSVWGTIRPLPVTRVFFFPLFPGWFLPSSWCCLASLGSQALVSSICPLRASVSLASCGCRGVLLAFLWGGRSNW